MYQYIFFIISYLITALSCVHAGSISTVHSETSSHPVYEVVVPDQPVYLSSLGFGPSSFLRGKIVITHVFWQDEESNKWTKEKQKLMLDAWDKSSIWLKNKLSSEYDTEVNFINEVITVQPDNLAKHIVDIKTQNNSMRNTTQLARYFGHHTAQTYLDSVKKKHRADSVALFIYINKKSKSFTHRCMKKCKFVGEYAYIIKHTDTVDIEDIMYTQIHELLHLFGADDLYKVAGAENYYRDDMLHHPPNGLENIKISPITAYSIGALNSQPTTPFTVERNWSKKIKEDLSKP